ncbi:MAG: tRNA preQ1(34) S-adenosylmethionine ribosyltransferase-isomerase QueA [Desulfuromonas sp.]|nr:MAG: tRNA preQ1(34) S-adenosylmethionine ribosyltransferase-isomerase QueA [Desulfuromonas sp.]
MPDQRLSDFDFSLPDELIAQYPAPSRSDSRLLVLNRDSRVIEATEFAELPDLLIPGDLLVVNDTRVIPARLFGIKDSGGKVELLLTRREPGDDEVWHCLVKASRSPREGSHISFADNFTGVVLPGGDEPQRRIRFHGSDDFSNLLQRHGELPLPPYIRRRAEKQDTERYQTLFAAREGALAAPTAGLHFSRAVLDRLRSRGVETCPVTLHVGIGTFLPVRVENLSEHRMHKELFEVSESSALTINEAKEQGRRVIALGTTSVRVLESVARTGRVAPGKGETDLFITPGFNFQIVDALVTNFHLPKSTLLMLVSAFAGKEFLLQAYEKAVRDRFRFFSYGDCMLIE